MGFITTGDDIRIFYKDWRRETPSPLYSTTAGRSSQGALR